MKTIHVVDIDRTIADGTHREHLLVTSCVICLSRKPPSYGTSHCHSCGMLTESIVDPKSLRDFMDPERVMNDHVIPGSLNYINKLRNHPDSHEVHFLTGRGYLSRGITESWLLAKFDHKPNEQLITRSMEEDPLSAPEYKEKAFINFSKGYSKGTLFVFYEDEPRLLEMYSKYGIVVECPGAWDYLRV